MGFRDVFRRFAASSRESAPVSSLSEQKGLTIIADETGFVESRSVSQSIRSYGTDGLSSNVVMAPVMWVMRTFTEAQAIVERRKDDRLWEPVTDHPVEQLIDRPNEAYDGDALWKATSLSYQLSGNAYWRKVRNVFGEVVQLWYVPHWCLTPRWPSDGSAFISHYDYATGIGPQIPLAPRDVVHFRFGLDPENVRLGLSPLHSLLREVCTDDEAARFSETILENMGVPGLVISPEQSAAPMKPDAAEKLRDYIKSAFSGRRRGEAMVMGQPTKVSEFGFDPNKLMLGNLRDIAEERVCAVMGLPAAIVGFGSGLQSTKVGATMRELRQLAWAQCLTPMQKSLAKQLTAQLLPDFVAQTRRFRVRFDDSDVAVFQEDRELQATIVTKLVQSGVLRVDRAQAQLGLEVDETQQVYLRPSNTTPDGPSAPKPVLAPAPDPSATDPAASDAAHQNDGEAAAAKADQTLFRAIALRLNGPVTNGNGNGTSHHASS